MDNHGCNDGDSYGELSSNTYYMPDTVSIALHALFHLVLIAI